MMRKKWNEKSLFVLVFLTLLAIISCRHDVDTTEPWVGKGYPEEIGKIIVTKCAVSGCHNNLSKEAASGLSLETWNTMFEGTSNGTAVIPYRKDQSTLFFYSNTFDDLGIKLNPTMPLGEPPLSKAEVTTLMNWINAGAQDENGFVKFSDNPVRSKIYITNQGCDIVAVIDAESKRIMRMIDVGKVAGGSPESPHMIKVSPDGQYWFIIFLNGNVMQRFRTSDDAWAGEITIGAGFWNTMVITPDGKKAFAVDYNPLGKVVYLDLENMVLKATYNGLFSDPHGVAVNNQGDLLYVARQKGNHLYRVDISDPLDPQLSNVVLQPGQTANGISSFDPHEIIFTPDGTKYFVTCQGTAEVRVFNAANDSLIAVINTGTYPQEIAVSNTTDFLFVSCMEDQSSAVIPVGGRGSVAIINYQTNALVKSVYSGFQPHGLAVDEARKRVYVANRNVSPSGPAPHHATDCGGRNGYVTIIDINTLEMMPKYRHEVSVDPYSVAVRP